MTQYVIRDSDGMFWDGCRWCDMPARFDYVELPLAVGDSDLHTSDHGLEYIDYGADKHGADARVVATVEEV